MCVMAGKVVNIQEEIALYVDLLRNQCDVCPTKLSAIELKILYAIFRCLVAVLTQLFPKKIS